MSATANLDLDVEFSGADDGGLNMGFFGRSKDDGGFGCGSGVETAVFDVSL